MTGAPRDRPGSGRVQQWPLEGIANKATAILGFRDDFNYR